MWILYGDSVYPTRRNETVVLSTEMYNHDKEKSYFFFLKQEVMHSLAQGAATSHRVMLVGKAFSHRQPGIKFD